MYSTIDEQRDQEELEKIAAMLREKVMAKKATISEAERLADIERALKRMNDIRRGRAW